MDITNASQEDIVFMAKLAEQAERYDDMKEYVNQLISKVDWSLSISGEERNLFSAAYKNQVAARRSAWRIVSSLEQKEENQNQLEKLKLYRGKIEAEIGDICNEILLILHSRLLRYATDAESKVFFLKMKGDYQRYLAEVKAGDDRKRAAESTLLAYKSAQEIAVSDLAPTNSIRLGLALNFSVFYYEILNLPDLACNLAKQAFDEAISELDSFGEESYQDCNLIMQLLRDNLTLWTSSNTTENDGDEIKEASIIEEAHK